MAKEASEEKAYENGSGVLSEPEMVTVQGYPDAQNEAFGTAVKEVADDLYTLYAHADSGMNAFDPHEGDYQGDALAAVAHAKEALEALSGRDQETVAQEFHDQTIAMSGNNADNAYKVLGAMKGTAFAAKFEQLEAERLDSAGV